MKEKIALLAVIMTGAAVVSGATVAVSVFDDAKAWWRFDQGGADGSVVQASEIHDARNASAAVPASVWGSRGGPLWSVQNVRLPSQHKSVKSTALYLPCDTRTENGAAQCYQANALFGSGLQMHGDNVTVVARVRLEGNDVCAADCLLWNNAFNWNEKFGSAFGFIKTSGQRGNGTTYFPYAFVGNLSFGNATADKPLTLKIGEWYDVAYLYWVDEVDGTRYDNVKFVVAGDSGVRTHAIRKASTRLTSATSAYGRLGVQSENKAWKNYNTTISSNTGGEFKNFNGWVHQLALWERTLTMDEVLEAFGRPAANETHDVYAEAANWWKFDKDVNGDGIVQTDEIREVRHWDTMSECGAVAGVMSGPSGGPVWTNMNVYLPGKGVTVNSDCLYFPIATNIYVNGNGDTVYQSWPSTLTIPNSARTGSYTLMARIYPEQLVGGPSGHDAVIYDNALNWGNWSGAEFGINSGNDKTGNTFYPRAVLAHTWYNFTSLTMRTNTWYDIAFSVTDNGYDAQGNALTDTMLVAVQDAEHGFRTQTMSISTNAYTFYASWAGAAQLGSQNRFTALTDFWNATTKKEIGSGNSAKSYRGVIHQFAIWDRALTADEITAAFNHPCNMVMGVGSADGASSEFATSGGSYDYTLGEDWHGMAGALDATHDELTIRFTPDANNLKLVHALHVRTAAAGTAAGQTATLSATLNGKTVASPKAVGAFDDFWSFVPKSALVAGQNVLKLKYRGGTAASVAIDNVEMVGSWQLGQENNSDGEFVQEGSGRADDMLIGNRNMKSLPRALTTTHKTKDFTFYVPAELAENQEFDFATRLYNKAANEAGTYRILLNGVEKYATPASGLAKGEYARFSIEKGEIAAGWNKIRLEYTSSTGWITFDFFRLSLEWHNGTILIIR